MRKNKNERKRVSLYEFMFQFETEADATSPYIESIRWSQGRCCPRFEAYQQSES